MNTKTFILPYAIMYRSAPEFNSVINDKGVALLVQCTVDAINSNPCKLSMLRKQLTSTLETISHKLTPVTVNNVISSCHVLMIEIGMLRTNNSFLYFKHANNQRDIVLYVEE